MSGTTTNKALNWAACVGLVVVVRCCCSDHTFDAVVTAVKDECVEWGGKWHSMEDWELIGVALAPLGWREIET